MVNLNIIDNIISDKLSAREALKRLDEVASVAKTQAVLFVVDGQNKMIGSLSDGDVRRGFINGNLITESVTVFMHHDFQYLEISDYTTANIDGFKERNIRFVPLLDVDRRVLKILDLFNVRAFMPVDAIIMAGGRGERLRPLTDNLPKPLLEIGGKPIIEHNIDRLKKFGVINFNLTVKYLANQIEDYFKDGADKEIKIDYQHEAEPLGTIGALSLINNLTNDHVLVMNSDLLTNIDFRHFYDYFIENDADMCVASIPYFVNIPYAVLQLSDGKNVSSLIEKPTYTYYSNAGIYLIKKELISLIPKNKKFDATDFMESLIEQNKKLVSYPIPTTNYWLDIGRLEDYKKAQEDFKNVVF